jgi:hypothetical protein
VTQESKSDARVENRTACAPDLTVLPRRILGAHSDFEGARRGTITGRAPVGTGIESSARLGGLAFPPQTITRYFGVIAPVSGCPAEFGGSAAGANTLSLVR